MHAFNMFEDALHAPETSAGEDRDSLLYLSGACRSRRHVGRIGKRASHQTGGQSRCCQGKAHY